jgi:exodeoxyribonuclease VII small subunit
VAEKKEITFESKIENSKELLEELINPDITLSDSVKIYKKGLEELELAQKLLDEAKMEFVEL